LQRQVAYMEDMGWVRESPHHGHIQSPLHLKVKAKTCCCIDLRAVNSATIHNAILFRMEDLIDSRNKGHDELGSRSGISSVPLKPDECEHCVPLCNRLMEYTVMPFGAAMPQQFFTVHEHRTQKSILTISSWCILTTFLSSVRRRMNIFVT
jgi:hypothetical protein